MRETNGREDTKYSHSPLHTVVPAEALCYVLLLWIPLLFVVEGFWRGERERESLKSAAMREDRAAGDESE